MRFLRFVLPLLALTLGACAHEAENTGMRNSESTITLPAIYAMEMPVPAEDVVETKEMASPIPAVASDSVLTAGRVSRFQRAVIVPGGPDTAGMSANAQSFDAIMDHLETLMAAEIEKNNRYAMAGDVGMTAQR